MVRGVIWLVPDEGIISVSDIWPMSPMLNRLRRINVFDSGSPNNSPVTAMHPVN